jgi:microcompartment protein CcmK/EutM
VAVDSHGNAVLVWYRDDGANWRIQARRRTASGSFSAVQSISPVGQDAVNPQVAVDGNGNAVIAWTRYDGANNRVQVRRRTTSGSLSAVQTISAAGQSASSVHLAVDSSGNALVVWERYDGAHYRIQARRRTAGGNLSSVQTLSAAGQNAFDPHVAMDSSGNAVVVWRRYDGANDRIQVRRRTPSGALSAVQTLSAAGRPAFGPQVAVDPAGNAVVSWERYDGADSRIQVRRRTASGNLSAVQTLSATGQGASQSQVAVDKVGNAIVAWMVYDGAHYRVQVVRRTAGGALSEVKTLSAAGQDGIGPQLAVDGGGNAVVTWQQFDGAHARILARRRSTAGNLGEVQTLSAAGHDAVGHEVAIDGSGNAVVTWQWHDGSYYLIQAARLRTG